MTTKAKEVQKEIRYEIEVEGAKGFLAPLTFPVAEASLGFMFKQFPKKISAGEIVLNSLFLHGSPKYKNSKPDSPWFVKASLEASNYDYTDRIRCHCSVKRPLVNCHYRSLNCESCHD